MLTMIIDHPSFTLELMKYWVLVRSRGAIHQI